MSLPKSVQAQAEAARQHFEAKPENPEEQPPADPAPEGGERNPQEEPPAPDEPKPEEKTQPADDPAKHEPKAEDPDALYWKHRFQVIQGKYNREIPALRQENDELKQQAADKDRRIAELEQQAPTADGSGLSDEQIAQFRTTFGEDLVDFVERMVTQRAPAPQADTGNTRELQERLERLESEKQEDAQARFWVNLEQAVPTFREVNADPKFHQFLAQFDPQTGKQRQQTLSEAQQALDAKGVADIFRAYLNQAAPAPRPTVPEEQVEPRTTRATEAPQGKKLWTRADINQFYRDKTAGRYGAEEAERLEADIFAAQREGRVR
ncbi:hypothetical protein HPA02_08320 [Bisbaumannia pacifica]|uniref:Uncharacterized protein n=1 Tax=Bisbaumannia pacifica TaxID=77098 RepID=A0A510X571_9GAMM|nr:hypothetical protein [Halomonas pacifica]GEK46549.1 hypothetical protein HPA02_08320 [Halomonas pacifica]